MDECNTYGCAHAGCKPLQVFNKCIPETAAIGDISDVPTEDGSPAPVGVRVRMVEPVDVELHAETNTMRAKARIAIQLQWEVRTSVR